MQFSKTDGNRDKVFQLRLTEAELQWIHAEAKRRGIKAAELLRMGLDLLAGHPVADTSPTRKRGSQKVKRSKVAGSKKSPLADSAKVKAASNDSPSSSQGTVQ